MRCDCFCECGHRMDMHGSKCRHRDCLCTNPRPPLTAQIEVLKEEAEDLRGTLRMLMLATINLAPYPPDVAEGVVAIVDAARAALSKAEKP